MNFKSYNTDILDKINKLYKSSQQWIIVIIICVLFIFILYYNNSLEYFRLTEYFRLAEYFGSNSNSNSELIFTAPQSLTQVDTKTGPVSRTTGTTTTTATTAEPNPQALLATLSLSEILLKIKNSKEIIDGNILEFPSFFHVAEKWPGCLPRPLYQGTCGSCWGFASVTALSSRFYIESCGLSGCKNYPQINFGSINNVNYNINDVYKFKKLYLTDAFENMDVNKNGLIGLKEWMDVIEEYHKTFSSQASPYIERHYIAQILVYFLNFQSLGSIDLTNKNKVKERATEAFYIWISLINKNKELIESENFESESESNTKKLVEEIDLKELTSLWLKEPITLSAEKIISCCNNCMKLDFETGAKKDNPVCLGSTLDEAWSMLRESGTTTVDCIGYNLDSWTPGSYSPSCKEVQGPLYSFCSGYVIDKSNFQLGDRSGTKSTAWTTDIDSLIDKYENSGINPIAVPNNEKNIPWIDPQLFRFRAKNVYKIKNNVKSIQREILERGPVTSGFVMYPDFQYEFGLNGGQMYKEEGSLGPLGPLGPLGSTKKSLIYMWNGKGNPIGGHAITIVGWGQYTYKETIVDEKTGIKKEGAKYEVPYWICLNSWGQKWGTSGFSKYNNRTGLPTDMKSGGYFWILRGVDMCSIENNVIIGQPDIDNISYPNVPDRYGWGLPNPNVEDVEYVKQKTELIDLGSNNFLSYQQPNEGGGSYTDRIVKDGITTWAIESMKAPSPYVLFWGASRPIYCVGKTGSKLSEYNTDNIIEIDSKTVAILKEIQKIQKNPLMIIDDEQIQLLEISEINSGSVSSGSIKVNRGVNNSYLSKHTKDVPIKVIPFKTLSVDALDKLAPKCEDTLVTVE